MDVTSTWGFGKGRKRKAADPLKQAAKRAEKAAARKAKRARNARRGVCYCAEYPYPHRPGSHGSPSSASYRERAHHADRSGPVGRKRLKRLTKWAKHREAARWGWRGGEAAPF